MKLPARRAGGCLGPAPVPAAMGFHTFDASEADRLEDPARFEYLSVDELLALFDPEGVVLDLGSGSGFYTDRVAPRADRLCAVDVQPAMHARYRTRGVPAGVHPVTAAAAALPLRDGAVDRALSTMTYHEVASDAVHAELARVVRAGGLVGVADWTRAGAGAAGPPLEERYTAVEARNAFETAGFTVERAEDRRETFVLRARRD